MSRPYDETFDEIAQEVRTRHPGLDYARIEDISRTVMHLGSVSLWRLSPGVRGWELIHRLQKLEAAEPALFVGTRTSVP